jgi:hypothetical protein
MQNNNLEEKYSTIHYLSWNLNDWINMNLFEAVVWRGRDTSGYRGYDVNYLNPIIFYRPVDFSIGSPDNVLMGAGLNLIIKKQILLYGQLIIDEFKLNELKAQTGWWANKFGMQAGFKIYDLMNIKNLFLQSEINFARPFTYSHSNSLTNYGNYYQSMAHPIGANFEEINIIAKYRKNRLLFSLQLNYAKFGIDTSNVNYGQNIYRSYNDGKNEFGNNILQGHLQQILYAEFKVATLINPKWNMYFEAGIRHRKQSNNIESKQSDYIFIGFNTALYNKYREY